MMMNCLLLCQISALVFFSWLACGADGKGFDQFGDRITDDKCKFYLNVRQIFFIVLYTYICGTIWDAHTCRCVHFHVSCFRNFIFFYRSVQI